MLDRATEEWLKGHSGGEGSHAGECRRQPLRIEMSGSKRINIAEQERAHQRKQLTGGHGKESAVIDAPLQEESGVILRHVFLRETSGIVPGIGIHHTGEINFNGQQGPSILTSREGIAGLKKSRLCKGGSCWFRVLRWLKFRLNIWEICVARHSTSRRELP